MLYENEKNWTLVIRIEKNGNKNIISIWHFNRKRSPYGGLIKHKSHLCPHGVIHKWGVNYWKTYSPVVNWMSVKAILTMIIIR